jgi:hypothetical protein
MSLRSQFRLLALPNAKNSSFKLGLVSELKDASGLCMGSSHSRSKQAAIFRYGSKWMVYRSG